MLNKHSLILRLAMVLVLTSLIAGVVAVRYYYQSIYQQEVDKAQLAIDQLHKTVSSTASIAAYLKDKDLALEVVSGLIKNDVILGAQISSEDTMLAEQGANDVVYSLSYELFNPFFENEVAGKITLTPAQNLIEYNARNIAQNSALLLVVHTVVVLLMFIVIAYFIVTKPMGLLSKDLMQIVPGTDNRIDIPFAHNDSEIGEIAKSINGMLQDAESHFNQERELRKEVQELGNRLQLLFEHASSAMILAQRSGKIMLFNASTAELLKRLNLTISSDLYELVDRAFMDGNALKQHIADNLNKNDVARGEYQLINDANGDEMWVHILVTRSYAQDNTSYLQIFINDITSHKNELAHLSHKASTDKLTGLLNRAGAEREIEARLSAQQALTLMLIDLDGFKPINDIHGHDAGDIILCHVAKQLQMSLRKGDLCIRWGGDEFVVVVESKGEESAIQLAEKLRAALSTPITLDNGEQVAVGASIGVAMSPLHGVNIKDLVSAADKAMYSVKHKDKNATALAPI
ncbi:diguanylate cyclase [Pseudoalteromonas sp. YIC-656]|uniref:sensor domain-containing diguanylate cyclase n=1 Tax=Pseudoalteromonas pernae TaxID=3118054 RepID=UPI003241BE8D